MIAQLPGELVHHLLEDDRVNVESEHVEQEPVAHLCLLDDNVDALFLYKPEPDIQKVRLGNSNSVLGEKDITQNEKEIGEQIYTDMWLPLFSVRRQ